MSKTLNKPNLPEYDYKTVYYRWKPHQAIDAALKAFEEHGHTRAIPFLSDYREMEKEQTKPMRASIQQTAMSELVARSALAQPPYYSSQTQLATMYPEECAMMQAQAAEEWLASVNPSKCPDCGHVSVINANGGGVRCITPQCGYWFCY